VRRRDDCHFNLVLSQYASDGRLSRRGQTDDADGDALRKQLNDARLTRPAPLCVLMHAIGRGTTRPPSNL
jgi:hypothetical protein